MAKSKTNNTATTAKGKHPGTGRTCGECRNGVYSQKHANIDINGRKFLKLCTHSHWAHNAEGTPVCLTSTGACEHFVEL